MATFTASAGIPGESAEVAVASGGPMEATETSSRHLHAFVQICASGDSDADPERIP